MEHGHVRRKISLSLSKKTYVIGVLYINCFDINELMKNEVPFQLRLVIYEYSRYLFGSPRFLFLDSNSIMSNIQRRKKLRISFDSRMILRIRLNHAYQPFNRLVLIRIITKEPATYSNSCSIIIIPNNYY